MLFDWTDILLQMNVCYSEIKYIKDATKLKKNGIDRLVAGIENGV